jgi:glycosyltransferase involved in cell wall biosynthesis
MKLLLVINSLGTGGAEKLLVETIPKYKEKNIEVEILLLNGEEHLFYKELQDGHSCPIHSLSKGTVYNPMLLFKIIPFIKKFDIVHVHLFPAFYWVAIAKLFTRSQTKLIFTEHNTTNRRRTLLFKPIERYIYGKYIKIITISKEVQSSLVAHLKFPSDRFVRIENGVNLAKIEAAEKISTPFFDNPKTDKILIQVSRFYDQKDQKTLVKALKYLPSSIKLLLVGDGKNKQDVQLITKKLSLNSRVKFLGERSDVPSLLKTADIIVLSSKFEGLSLSSIEGMAAGKPFIGSNVPGLTDIVKGAGILFPLGDEKVLAKEILALLENKEQYSVVAKKCKMRAAQYDIHLMLEKHITLYRKLTEMD